MVSTKIGNLTTELAKVNAGLQDKLNKLATAKVSGGQQYLLTGQFQH